jgi:hypothetical protein
MKLEELQVYSQSMAMAEKIWLTKARNRKLLDDSDFDLLIKQIDDIGIKLNNYIKSIGKSK